MRLRTLVLAFAVLSAAAPPGFADPPRSIASYGVFAGDSIDARSLHVLRGDVGVNVGTLTVRGALDAPRSIVAADTLQFVDPTACTVDQLFAATASVGPCGAARAFVSPILAPNRPLHEVCDFPPPVACDALAPVRVVAGETRRLPPGRYGDVTVDGGQGQLATLIFQGGDYVVCSLRSTPDAQITFAAPASVQVADGLTIGDDTFIGPAAGAPFSAGDVRLFVSGLQVRVRRKATVRANVCAPNGEVRLNQEAFLVGRIVARFVVARDDAVVGLEIGTIPTTTTSTATSTSSSSVSTTSTSSTSTSTTSTSTTASSSSTSSTSTTAPQPVCGNGIVEVGEECEPGDTDPCCNSSCRAELEGTLCGARDACSGDEACQGGTCTLATPVTALGCLAANQIGVVTTFEDGMVALLSPTDDTLVAHVPVGTGPWGVALPPLATEAWVTNREADTVSLIDLTTRAVRATVPVGALPLGIAADPAGTRAYVASFDADVVTVIDAASGNVAATFRTGLGPSGVIVDPTGTRLYVSNFADDTVSVVDPASNTVVATVATGAAPLGMAIDRRRGRLYVTNHEGASVSVIGTSSATEVARIAVGSKPFGVAVDDTVGRAYVANGADDTLSVIDTAANVVVALVPVGRSPLGVALDVTGRRVYVAAAGDGAVQALDPTSGGVVATLDVGPLPVGFGRFLGALAGACPRSSAACDDADPAVTGTCEEAAGCRYGRLPAPAAADAGLSALDARMRSATAEELGGQRRAGKLGATLASTRGLITPGGAANTPKRRLKRIEQGLRRLERLLRRGLRRGTLDRDLGLRLLDLARGTGGHVRAVRGAGARLRRASPTERRPAPGAAMVIQRREP